MLYLWCICVVFVLYLCCVFVLLDSSCLVQLMFVPLSDSRLAADAQNWQVTSLFGQRGQGEKESLCAQYKLYVNSVKFSFIWEQEKDLSDEQTSGKLRIVVFPSFTVKHLQRLQTNNPITTKLGKKGNMFFFYIIGTYIFYASNCNWKTLHLRDLGTHLAWLIGSLITAGRI